VKAVRLWLFYLDCKQHQRRSLQQSNGKGNTLVIVVFKITHRPDLPRAEYEEVGARMVELVSAMPGFIGMDYAETEGGELLIARFESHDALAEWRNLPEHRAAQDRGRREFFAAYRIDVCEPVRSYDFQAEGLGGN
jgi:heme-degrading monooxygenase HmoA